MIPHLRKTENLAPLRPDRAALHEIACAYAEEQFKLKGGCDATWLVAAGAQVAWIETPFEGVRDKQATTAMIRAMLAATGAQAYSYATEAFVAAVQGMPPGEVKKWLAYANEHGVSALPARMREDVLMVFTHDRGGGVSITRYLVTMRRGKGPNFLGPRVDETDDPTQFAGPMFNLFVPERPLEDYDAS